MRERTRRGLRATKPHRRGILATLGVLIGAATLFFTAVSSDAARDAAEASLAQVEAATASADAARAQFDADTLPVLNVGYRRLAGFHYQDGRQLPQSHHSPYDVSLRGRTLYIAVTVRNFAPGYARVLSFRASILRSLDTKTARGPHRTSQNWLVPPGEEVPLSIIYPLDDKTAKAAARDLKLRNPFVIEIFYKDIGLTRLFKTTLVISKEGGRLWHTLASDFHRGWWPTRLRYRPPYRAPIEAIPPRD